jgi:hypothetical protein
MCFASLLDSYSIFFYFIWFLYQRCCSFFNKKVFFFSKNKKSIFLNRFGFQTVAPSGGGKKSWETKNASRVQTAAAAETRFSVRTTAAAAARRASPRRAAASAAPIWRRRRPAITLARTPWPTITTTAADFPVTALCPSARRRRRPRLPRLPLRPSWPRGCLSNPASTQCTRQYHSPFQACPIPMGKFRPWGLFYKTFYSRNCFCVVVS